MVDRRAEIDAMRELERVSYGEAAVTRECNAVWKAVDEGFDADRDITVAEAIARFGRDELRRALMFDWVVAVAPESDDDEEDDEGMVRTEVANSIDEAKDDMLLEIGAEGMNWDRIEKSQTQ